MNWDFKTWIAMILLGAPVATLAVVHKVEWGNTFGFRSGLWRPSAILAAILLTSCIAAVACFGADPVRRALLSESRRGDLLFYGLPGLGLAIAIFPQAASGFSKDYKEMVINRSTKHFNAVGWGLFAIWLAMRLLNLIGHYGRL